MLDFDDMYWELVEALDPDLVRPNHTAVLALIKELKDKAFRYDSVNK